MTKGLLMVLVMAFVVCEANAQLSVYSNGYVGVATSSSTTPVSAFSVKGGMAGYDASIIGTARGLHSESNGQYLNWSYGVYGKSKCASAGFQVGVTGNATITQPQSSCRTYGVLGLAGNAQMGGIMVCMVNFRAPIMARVFMVRQGTMKMARM